MIVFSNWLHFSVIMIMFLALAYIIFEVVNVVRLNLADKKYRGLLKRKSEVDFGKMKDTEDFFYVSGEMFK